MKLKTELNAPAEGYSNPIDRTMRDEARRIRRMMAVEDPAIAALSRKGRSFKKTLAKQSSAIVSYEPEPTTERAETRKDLQILYDNRIRAEHFLQTKARVAEKREVVKTLLRKLDLI